MKRQKQILNPYMKHMNYFRPFASKHKDHLIIEKTKVT